MAGEDIVDSAKDGLTTKIGGVPFYVYGVGFVIGFYLYKRYRTAHSAAETGDTTDTADSGTSQTGAGSIYDGNTDGQGTLFPSSGSFTNGSGNYSNVAAGDSTDQSFDAWKASAVKYLVQNNYDGAQADQALTSYGGGQSLNTTQWRMIALAIAGVGAAPGVTPQKAPGGSGISFNIPSSIAAIVTGNVPVYLNDPVGIDIIWKDAQGNGISGQLQRMAVTGSTWLAREVITVVAGKAHQDLKASSLYSNWKWVTLPLDPTHLHAESNVERFYVKARPVIKKK